MAEIDAMAMIMVRKIVFFIVVQLISCKGNVFFQLSVVCCPFSIISDKDGMKKAFGTQGKRLNVICPTVYRREVIAHAIGRDANRHNQKDNWQYQTCVNLTHDNLWPYLSNSRHDIHNSILL